MILRVQSGVLTTVTPKLEAEQFTVPSVRLIKSCEMKWLVKAVKTIPKISSKAGRAAP